MYFVEEEKWTPPRYVFHMQRFQEVLISVEETIQWLQLCSFPRRLFSELVFFLSCSFFLAAAEISVINPALQPNSIPESSTYVFFQTLCQSPVFSVPRKLFRIYSQIQDLAILGYQW